MTTVDGKVVLITGGARGIGAETARVLAARGARIALVGLEPTMLAQLADELGGVWAEADVTDIAALDRAVAHVVTQTGGIDIVMANAGIASLGTINSTAPEAFQRCVDINLTGVWNTAKVTVEHLKATKGYLLVIASIASFTPIPGLAAYAASKAGAEALAFALRGELAPSGVAVGCCHPSWIDTDLVRDAEADLPSFKEVRAKLPWPTNSTSSVRECADLIAAGIERRKRRIFVPKRAAAMLVIRPFMTSPLVDRVIRKVATTLVPQMDAEVERLGRSLSAKQLDAQRR